MINNIKNFFIPKYWYICLGFYTKYDKIEYIREHKNETITNLNTTFYLCKILNGNMNKIKSK